MKNHWTIELTQLTEITTGSPIANLGKHNRYWIAPKALMEAQRYGHEHDWIILGVYHSHPDHPAVPSERDRCLAWSEYSYPIVSVIKGQVVETRSWRLTKQRMFQPEEIIWE